ncbi:MAG: murein hydrolase activator EnvC family protein [Legionellales bacterium]
MLLGIRKTHRPIIQQAGVLAMFCCFSPFGYSAPLLQTQTTLQNIDAKINTLQSNLATEHNKQGILNHKLSSTEKQIGDGVRTLRSIQNNMHTKEQKIAMLQSKVQDLNEQLIRQQQLLASHVRARYQMGEYQPLKWLINQDDPYRISRILTYYQSIISARKHLIDQIDLTRAKLNAHKEFIRKELAENKQLQVQLTQHQKELLEHKNIHTALIESLNKTIQTKELTLAEFKKNKKNLVRLVRSLAQQSTQQESKSFEQMRRKLPLPVHTAHKSLQRMNQGVTFFADEGTQVTAVYPGKVVFSDWLKGYGLLLIIDHGQGFMTLYAHNQSLFKGKGQTVQQNEPIASVGHSGGIKQNGLYFEVRAKGKAISPFEWLA